MGEEKLFNVVLVGGIKEGLDKSVVKSNLATLFKLPLDKAGALINGQSVVVKGSVDTDTAVRYKAAIERAGAVCRLEAVVQEEPLEFDFTKEPPAITKAVSPPVTALPPVNRARQATANLHADAPQIASAQPNEKELHRVIDGLSISDGKKRLFKLIASTPLKAANGVPVFDSDDKRLKPFRASLTEKDSIWCGWAFLFQWLYWFGKGMWKKGIVLAVILITSQFLIISIFGGKMQLPVGITFSMLCASMANYDLYRKQVLKEEFWW